jgi:hypothetical protein
MASLTSLYATVTTNPIRLLRWALHLQWKCNMLSKTARTQAMNLALHLLEGLSTKQAQSAVPLTRVRFGALKYQDQN